MPRAPKSFPFRESITKRRFGASWDEMGAQYGVDKNVIRRHHNATLVTKPTNTVDVWLHEITVLAQRAPEEDYKLEFLRTVEFVREMARNRAAGLDEKIELICSQFQPPDLPKTRNEIIEDSGLSFNEGCAVIAAAIAKRFISVNKNVKPNQYKLR